MKKAGPEKTAHDSKLTSTSASASLALSLCLSAFGFSCGPPVGFETARFPSKRVRAAHHQCESKEYAYRSVYAHFERQHRIISRQSRPHALMHYSCVCCTTAWNHRMVDEGTSAFSPRGCGLKDQDHPGEQTSLAPVLTEQTNAGRNCPDAFRHHTPTNTTSCRTCLLHPDTPH
eukprot:3142890-Rhodomonas_salina.3